MLPLIVINKIDVAQQDWMSRKWYSTAKDIGIKSTQAREFFDLICEQYKQKHRAYHNLSHLYSLFHVAEQYDNLIEDKALFELSIWFHDIIYSIQRKDNELKSAELATALLKPYLSGTDLNKIAYMIRATSNHQSNQGSSDLQYLLDMDLSIFAAERSVYKKYKKAIRKEFKRYPNFLYKIGRRKVLFNFLKMDKIYQTEQFHLAFETIARENIQWELDNL